jgi:hypothetical protein
MSQQISYNQLIDYIEDFSDNHLQLQRFGEGFRADINLISTEENNFPILYVEPLSHSVQNWVQRYRIRIYCLDLLQQDKSNRREILSDCLQILNDLYKYIKNDTDNNFDVSNIPTSLPVQNISIEGVAGWSSEFEILVTINDNICDIPLD